MLIILFCLNSEKKVYDNRIKVRIFRKNSEIKSIMWKHHKSARSDPCLSSACSTVTSSSSERESSHVIIVTHRLTMQDNVFSLKYIAGVLIGRLYRKKVPSINQFKDKERIQRWKADEIPNCVCNTLVSGITAQTEVSLSCKTLHASLLAHVII